MNINSKSFSLANLTFKHELVQLNSTGTATHKFSTPFKNECLIVIPFDVAANTSTVFKVAVSNTATTKEGCQLFSEYGSQSAAILAIGY